MKQLLTELAAYHVWANQQLLSCILSMDSLNWTKEIPSSFPSLHKTLLHMLDADSIWWQRLNGNGPVNVPSKSFTGNTIALGQELIAQNKLWSDYVQSIPEESLLNSFKYTNLKGEHFEQPVYQLLAHLFNHGTYHRGQLVTMLRTLGQQQLPQTDFVHYARMK